jgi:DNA-binding response OmpR family regulator
LEAAGYETRAVGTFEEAQHRLRHSSPDLLITDIRLGAFNGLHLLIAAGNRLPVILMTGFDDPVLKADARRYGAEYVLKPLDPVSFLRLVQRRLGRILRCPGHLEMKLHGPPLRL